MVDHSPGCPFASESAPDDDALQAAVHHAAYAYLAGIGATPGCVVTIHAVFETIESAPPDQELIARITIGVGRQAQDRLAAEYAQDRLNGEGVPWLN